MLELSHFFTKIQIDAMNAICSSHQCNKERVLGSHPKVTWVYYGYDTKRPVLVCWYFLRSTFYLIKISSVKKHLLDLFSCKSLWNRTSLILIFFPAWHNSFEVTKAAIHNISILDANGALVEHCVKCIPDCKLLCLYAAKKLLHNS